MAVTHSGQVPYTLKTPLSEQHDIHRAGTAGSQGSVAFAVCKSGHATLWAANCRSACAQSQEIWWIPSGRFRLGIHSRRGSSAGNPSMQQNLWRAQHAYL